MKRLVSMLLCSIVLCTALAAVVVPRPVQAVNVFGVCSENDEAGNTDVCKEKSSAGSSDPVITALKITITIMAFVIGFTAVIMIIISGINMITSGGDPQKVASSRSTLLYAIIGVVIAMFAEGIVAFVLNKL